MGRTQKTVLLSFALLLIACQIHAVPSDRTAQNPISLSFGVETDTLPYITGGYHAAAWFGFGKWRLRGVLAQANLPAVFDRDGFEEKQLNAYGLMADRFFGKHATEHRGFWLAFGPQYWAHRVENTKENISNDVRTYVLSVGFGYVWKIYKGLYASPYGGGHFWLTRQGLGEMVGSEVYQSPIVVPEVSIKMGYAF